LVQSIKYREVAKSPKLAAWIDDVGLPATPAGSVSSIASQAPLARGAKQVVGNADQSSAPADLTASGLLWLLSISVAGGFILNFMPCVLPVIGIKVMSFFEEGAGDPRRVVWLNFWYVLGILAFMMSLGLITVLAKEYWGTRILWGEQFSYPEFRIAVLVIVFAMSLSFFGVWEIPIPGFANSRTSHSLAQREGALGAFSKGALTTLVATPCTGPFLGTALSLSLTQPSWIVLAVFFAIGIGLSLPYTVIAMFPSTVSFLPKPGVWMDRLKQFMAFPLILTCVFLLTTFPMDERIAALTMLCGVAFACWWIGQVPAYANMPVKARGWGVAIASAVVFGLLSFQYLGPTKKVIAWEPFSQKRLDDLIAQGKTVMIDFTAEWCLNCKTNLKLAIETPAVAEKIRTNRVVAMLADFTNKEDEAIKSKLEELNSNGIPLLAIYPSTQPDQPILHRALLTQGVVLESLDRAGPSRR
jgi:thiol:disulfide interchange protein